MVTTAIRFKSPGIIYRYLSCPGSILTMTWKFFYRQPDGSLPTVVLMVLLNLLGAVSLCKVFLRFITHLVIHPFCRICWPISADQPAAAAHLSENLNVAFELIQVRTGDGLKPLARNGVAAEGTREAVGIEIRQTIDLCRSEKGREMKSNAEQIKVKFAQSWEEDGVARQEIRKFLDKYTWTLSCHPSRFNVNDRSYISGLLQVPWRLTKPNTKIAQSFKTILATGWKSVSSEDV